MLLPALFAMCSAKFGDLKYWSSLEREMGNKTLVVWAAPANLDQSGGSLLTLDDGSNHFDGIVFGEIAPRKWMAGSDYHIRTQLKQDDYPAETAKSGEMIQIAIAYEGNWIRIYRNGKLYAEYQTGNRQVFDFGKGNTNIGFGVRFRREGPFAGEIEEVRLSQLSQVSGCLSSEV